ncbi:hypothetical protein KL943_005159 [Ogataea angusta]|nr:hypothetical protein KL943_005159 [Ogataea angusta]
MPSHHRELGVLSTYTMSSTTRLSRAGSLWPSKYRVTVATHTGVTAVRLGLFAAGSSPIGCVVIIREEPPQPPNAARRPDGRCVPQGRRAGGRDWRSPGRAHVHGQRQRRRPRTVRHGPRAGKPARPPPAGVAQETVGVHDLRGGVHHGVRAGHPAGPGAHAHVRRRVPLLQQQAPGRQDRLRLGSKPAARHADPVVAEPDWRREHGARERQDGPPERRVRTQAAARVQHSYLRGVRVSQSTDFRSKRGKVHAGAVPGGAFPQHARRLDARHHGAGQQLSDRRCRGNAARNVHGYSRGVLLHRAHAGPDDRRVCAAADDTDLRAVGAGAGARSRARGSVSARIALAQAAAAVEQKNVVHQCFQAGCWVWLVAAAAVDHQTRRQRQRRRRRALDSRETARRRSAHVFCYHGGRRRLGDLRQV